MANEEDFIADAFFDFEKGKAKVACEEVAAESDGYDYYYDSVCADDPEKSEEIECAACHVLDPGDGYGEFPGGGDTVYEISQVNLSHLIKKNDKFASVA